jgi:type II secretory pathway pseudopilin PulG
MRARRQSGFAYIAAVVLLVVVAGLAVALARLTGTQQATVDQALLGARAALAARGGIEWAYANLAGNCAAGAGKTTQLGDFLADSGFRVSVTCSVTGYNEGEASEGVPLQKQVYRIQAVACNGGGACPDADAVARPDYVERARVATICTAGSAFCD